MRRDRASLLMALLVVAVLWWFAIPYALRAGNVWHGMEHPMRDVQVHLSNNQVLQGDMRLSMSGNWVLTQSDGTVVYFRNPEVIVATPNSSASHLYAWRLWLPFLVVTLVPIALFIYLRFKPLIGLPKTH